MRRHVFADGIELGALEEALARLLRLRQLGNVGRAGDLAGANGQPDLAVCAGLPTEPRKRDGRCAARAFTAAFSSRTRAARRECDSCVIAAGRFRRAIARNPLIC
jgi:hypothetical protein